jgi:hypothetical protein
LRIPHKFKIGDTVNYRPGSRVQRQASGIYTVTGLRPENDGELGYKIKHCEDFERIAVENVLSVE